MVELTQTIDYVSKIVKARGDEQAREMISTQFPEIRETVSIDEIPMMTDEVSEEQVVTEEEPVKNYAADSLFLKLNQQQMEEAVSAARQSAQAMKDKIDYNRIMLVDPTMTVRRHQIEWHRRFTLSFACLIFFFIGAPLGAIIRKGGLGFPIVISVVLFVIYYIIDTTGYKMAREGFWQVFEGMWLSSAVLFPLGLFLTWKAVTDASFFRTESYTRIYDNMKEYYRKRRNKSRN